MWTPEDSIMKTETVLHSLSLYRLGTKQNQRPRNPHVRIYRTPVRATLEETSQECTRSRRGRPRWPSARS